MATRPLRTSTRKRDTKGKTMTALQATKAKASSGTTRAGRLFLLELSGGRIHAMNPDGSDHKIIVEHCHYPDGIVVDAEAGHIYWTNMGVSPSLNDGSIERADLDGKNRKVIVPPGGTFTPKQLHLEKASGKLYWGDREGMRVMRANLDGSHIETLVDPSKGESRPGKDETKWCVGITVDTKHGKIYWTQKGPTKGGTGSLRRANIDIPKDESPANRSDIEVLFDQLPEPIDLELDLTNGVLYWTDRGDPPRGNTVNRAPIDKKAEPEILIKHLMEGIGIALDVPGNRMFVTDFAGSLYVAKLDGSGERMLLGAQGNLTGIAYAEV
jgi:sugar lactone lactonase YvrE